MRISLLAIAAAIIQMFKPESSLATAMLPGASLEFVNNSTVYKIHANASNALDIPNLEWDTFFSR